MKILEEIKDTHAIKRGYLSFAHMDQNAVVYSRDVNAIAEEYALQFKPAWVSVGKEMNHSDIDQSAWYVMVLHGLKPRLIKGNRIITYFAMGQIDRLFKLPESPTT